MIGQNLRAMAVAVQLLIRLPLPAIASDRAEQALAIRWFPVAGLGVGVAVAVAAWLGTLRDPWAGALLAVLAWTAITGALHLDGLGDIADAAGAGHKDRARIDAVLADPHIGSFGVVAIVLQLAAKLVAARLFLGLHPAGLLVLVPVIARVAPLGWTLTLPPLHPGMGTRFGSGATPAALGAWLAFALAVSVWLAPALLVALPAAALWGLWLRSRIGGISGDGHGAGIELVETAMLMAGACL